MTMLNEFSEEDAVLDGARKSVERVIDRLIDLVLVPDPSTARSAASLLGLLSFRAADAIMAAFRRAETPRQRERLIAALESLVPRWHIAAQSFLERVARHDLDEGVQHQAADARRRMRVDDAFDDDAFDDDAFDDDFAEGALVGDVEDPFGDEDLW